MYMGRVSASPERDVLRELTGARVLITGLSASTGVDLARTFADLKTRLVVHTNDLSPEVTELIALLSQSAGEIKLYTDPIATAEASVRFAQNAAQAYGGLDAVINLAEISHSELSAVGCDQSLETLVSKKIAPLAYLTKVTANRMRVVLSEGLILNVLSMPHPRSGREAAIASLARTALAAMTQAEARTWAGNGIRINAIGPRVVTNGQTAAGASLANEPGIAALAIYLASHRGRALSGHIFDAEGVIERGD